MLAMLPAGAPERSFEVASIRVHTGEAPHWDVSTSGTRLTADAMDATGLMEYAFDVPYYRIAGVSDRTRYDIVARAEGPEKPSEAEFRDMVRSLLAERFGFRFHREMRQINVYALVVDKGGPKLKVSSGEEPCNYIGGLAFGDRGNYQVESKGCSIDYLPDGPGIDLDRPIVDKTGLKENYDFKLVFNRRDLGVEDDNGVGFATAIREQLGLRLEPQKVPLDVIVVDSLQKPSEN
jgi:uncharacterized protein (TIGR03435 family)